MSSEGSRTVGGYVPVIGTGERRSSRDVATLAGAVAASEALLFVGERSLALGAHAVTLAVASVLWWRASDRSLVGVLALVPTFRLLTLAVGVGPALSARSTATLPASLRSLLPASTATALQSPLIGTVAVYAVLLVVLVVVHRYLLDVEVAAGLTAGYVLLPWAAFFGWGLAELAFRALGSTALLETWSLAAVASVALVTVALVALVEEYLFRGLLQTTLEDRLGRAAGILLTSGLFGLVHVSAGLAGEALFAAAVGAFLGLLYDYTRSLAFVTVTHGILDLFLLAVLPVQGSLLPVLEGYLAVP